MIDLRFALMFLFCEERLSGRRYSFDLQWFNTHHWVVLIKGGGLNLLKWLVYFESVSCGSWGELQKKEMKRKLQKSFGQDAQ